MIKAVIFDLDNTLLDFYKVKHLSIDAATKAMIEAGLDLPEEEIKKGISKIYDKWGIEYDYVFEEYMKEFFGKIDWKVVANAIIAYRRVRDSLMQPYSGVSSTLMKMKKQGMQLAIVSDAPSLRAWLRLTVMKLDDFFDVVVAYDDTKQYKPSELPFKAALEKLGVKPEETLMVGDNIDRDIMGAKKLGMKTCFAKYGHIKGWSGKSQEHNADFEAEQFEDILNFVV
ncbi:MAG: TIGR02253 family HAD-type hydrolase [Candidatus Woesearchaeota archaeon]